VKQAQAKVEMEGIITSLKLLKKEAMSLSSNASLPK